MEPEKCKKRCFPLYLIQMEWQWDLTGDGNCILITALMVSIATPDGRAFLESPTHHLCQFFKNLMLVNKTRQEKK